MQKQIINILLIENNPTEARLLEEYLQDEKEYKFKINLITRISYIRSDLIKKNHFDVILLDLGMPDSTGLNSLLKLQKRAFNIPIIVLAGSADKELAIKAVRKGAQDYLIKGEYDTNLLIKSIRYAMEHHRSVQIIKNYSQNLKKSEEQLNNIIENYSDGMIIIDLKKKIRFFNPAAEKLIGKSQKEISNFFATFSIIPGKISEIELKKGKGKTRTMEMRISKIKWKGEDAFLASLRDISDRKNAEKMIIDMAKFPFENPNPVLRISEKGRILFYNKAVEDILKKTKLGKKDIYRILPKNLKEIIKKAYNLNKPVSDIEIKINKKVYSYTLAPLKEHHYINLYANDITEIKKTEKALIDSENKYRSLFESAAEGILITRLKSKKIKYANPAISKMLGYSINELINMNCQEIHPKSNFNCPIAESLKMRRREKKLFTNIPCLRKDGSLIYVNINTTHVVLGKQKFNIGFFSDITEQRRSEQDREKLQAQFQHIQKMEAIGRLAGGIAHDFNNLLTAILSYSDIILQDMKKSDVLYNDIQEIRNAASRGSSLTNQLLAFSKKQILRPEILNLNEIISNMQKMLKRLIGEQIHLITLFSKDLQNIKADRNKIEQVIMNLVVNAKDAMPKGGWLAIETSNVTFKKESISKYPGVIPGHYVMLSLKDTGIGIDNKIINNIFEPFFTTKKKNKGTGLGLSTVYGIVKQNNGYIYVSSQPKKGTEFKIYFPQVKAKVKKKPVKKKTLRDLKGQETILLVEDELSVRKAIMRMLQSSGYNIISAANPVSAIKIIEEHGEEIPLLLTDVVMPGMNGADLYKSLSKAHPKLKVIYMSGYTDNAIVDDGILKLGTLFIQKPFSKESLLSKVRYALGTNKIKRRPCHGKRKY